MIIIGGFIAASATVVFAVYMALGPREATEKSDDTPASALAQGGVRPAGQDSARRAGEPEPDETPDAAEPPPLPAPQPLDDPAHAERMRPVPPPEPPPPVVLSEEEQAAQDAIYAMRDKVSADASRELGKQTSALKKACWKPELAGGATNGSYSINASFDASGAMIGSGISDVRGGDAPAGVGECLRQQGIALKIPPPGQAVTVDLALRLP